MQFNEMVNKFRDRPFFETRELEMYFNDPKEQVSVNLSRWKKQNKIVQLRRGKYLLAEPYRHKQAPHEYIANYLYRPSYVSLQRALQFYGMIPEEVRMVQSVTTRDTRRWETGEGVFDYRSIKRERFWGYRSRAYSEHPGPQESFLIAVPEKSLLDLFYFQKNEWTTDRLREMRFQNLEQLNVEQLEEFTTRFDSPRITRTINRFRETYREALDH